jgi:hypothetical protein
MTTGSKLWDQLNQAAEERGCEPTDLRGHWMLAKQDPETGLAAVLEDTRGVHSVRWTYGPDGKWQVTVEKTGGGSCLLD